MSKAPFRKKNLMKLDAIREYIENYGFSEIDKAVLLTSLILALDKVDNTLGHFTSYLKNWSARSSNDLYLEVPKYQIYQKQHFITQKDVFDVIQNQHFDLAYFDPPYGSNNEKMPSSRVRYNGYYHFWKSVILYDKAPLFGKANRREDSRDLVSGSVFESYKKNEQNNFIAIEAIKNLIQQTDANYILFSYSNGGRATKEELNQVFLENSKNFSVYEIEYQANVMSSMKWTNEWNKEDDRTLEYLFLLEK